MNKPLLLVSVLVALTTSGLARADNDDCHIPMSMWQSREAINVMAVSQGWNVQRIKIDDGCYEIQGYDALGRQIEVKLNPATLEIVKFEYEDFGKDDGDDQPSVNTGPTEPDSNLSVQGTTPQ